MADKKPKPPGSYWNVEPVERFAINYKKTPPSGQKPKPTVTGRQRPRRPQPSDS